jgi:excisionase family DNA binding protein
MRSLDAYGDWLSVGELADYWDISTSTVYSMIEDGSIRPVVRLGARGQIRIPRTTILRMEGRANSSDGITEVKSPNTTEPDAVADDAPKGVAQHGSQ